MTLRTALIGTLVGLAVVPLFAEEKQATRKRSRRALRDLTAAVERFEELLEAEDHDAATKLANRMVEAHPKSPIARLMQRQVDLLELAPPTVDPADLTVRTYAVADLVVPIPRTATIGISGPVGPARATGIGVETDKLDKLDFETLIELVTSTVDPDSWSEVGGHGSVQFHETTLSLVIRQTDDVHDEVADLLQQLRRLQDVQVTLELRYVEVPNAAFERIGVDFDVNDAEPSEWRELKATRATNAVDELRSELTTEGHAVLDDAEMRALMNAVQSEARSNVLFAPKVTLFNGQTARILNSDVDGQLGLLVQAVATADRRHVRVKIARDGKDGIDVLSSTRSFSPADGHTVVIDRGTTVRERRQVTAVPVLGNVPHVNRLFKNTGIAREDVRLILTVTPRIIVREEEEELLGID